MEISNNYTYNHEAKNDETIPVIITNATQDQVAGILFKLGKAEKLPGFNTQNNTLRYKENCGSNPYGMNVVQLEADNGLNAEDMLLLTEHLSALPEVIADLQKIRDGREAYIHIDSAAWNKGLQHEAETDMDIRFGTAHGSASAPNEREGQYNEFVVTLASPKDVMSALEAVMETSPWKEQLDKSEIGINYHYVDENKWQRRERPSGAHAVMFQIGDKTVFNSGHYKELNFHEELMAAVAQELQNRQINAEAMRTENVGNMGHYHLRSMTSKALETAAQWPQLESQVQAGTLVINSPEKISEIKK